MSIFCPDQGRIRRRPKKGLWRDKQGFVVRRTSVRRSRKPAENTEQDKKGHLWMDTN